MIIAKTIAFWVAFLAIAASVAGAQEKKAYSNEELVAKVQKLHDELDRLQVSGTPEKQAEIFADDVVRMDPNHKVTEGKKPFLESMNRLKSEKFTVTSSKTKVLNAWQSGNMIFEYGTGELRIKTGAGGGGRDPIDYFMAWAVDPAGQYKVQFVIWNTAKPVAQTKMLAERE
jgi:ketosteroid isomerase-like protein